MYVPGHHQAQLRTKTTLPRNKDTYLRYRHVEPTVGGWPSSNRASPKSVIHDQPYIIVSFHDCCRFAAVQYLQPKSDLMKGWPVL